MIEHARKPLSDVSFVPELTLFGEIRFIKSGLGLRGPAPAGRSESSSFEALFCKTWALRPNMKPGGFGCTLRD